MDRRMLNSNRGFGRVGVCTSPGIEKGRLWNRRPEVNPVQRGSSFVGAPPHPGRHYSSRLRTPSDHGLMSAYDKCPR